MSEPKTIREARAREAVHKTRAQDSYDLNAEHEEDRPWTRGQSLEAPAPRSGMRQRWVRVGTYGTDDPTNVARKTREGWKPRPADTIPTSFQLPTISHGEWAGCVGIEGSVLMEMPETLAAKRDAHFRNKTNNITENLDRELQAQSNPLMPITQERKSQVGRLVKVAE